MNTVTEMLQIGRMSEFAGLGLDINNLLNGINQKNNSNMNLYSYKESDYSDKTEHSFLFILGKNGGTKVYEKEVLQPLIDIMTCMREMDAEDIYIADIELDNLDDIYYVVVVCQLPKC